MSQEITDQNFDQEIKNYVGVALVDFWAPWCGPCQMMGPIIEEVSKEVADKAKIAKLNVDENPQKAGEFNVMSIPTLIIFQKGKEVERLLGVQNKDSLIAKIKSYLE